MAKTPKGELTSAEIRKLIRAHNILVSIKIPKGLDRDGLIKLIEGKGYKVDHKKKAIIDAKKDRPRRPKVTLEKAKEVTKPKPKTELQKQKAAESKAEKEEKKKKETRAIKKEAIKEEKARSKPQEKPKPKPKKDDEVRPKEKVGRPKVDPKKIKVIQPKPKEESKPKRKADGEILKENGYTTLGEYKAEIKRLRGDKILSELPLKQRKVIVKYVEKIAKELGVKANIDTSKNLFQNQVGNLERQFGFLAEKLREGK